MGRGVMMDYYMAWGLPYDNAVSNHDRTITLISDIDSLASHFECSLDK
jgi:hypothetical protein